MDGKGGNDGGKLAPLMAKQIHVSNPTKLHHTNKSQKKLRLFLVGIFEIGEEHNKSRLENNKGRLRNRDQHSSGNQDVVGWNSKRSIFHERIRSRDEHEEHAEKTRRGTQENHSNRQGRSHIC